MEINLSKIDFGGCKSGGNAKTEVVLTETITSNGQQTFNPPAGSVYSRADITVNVPTSGGYTFKEGDNLWPANSRIKLWDSKSTGTTWYINDVEQSEQYYTTKEAGIYNIRVEGASNKLNYTFQNCCNLQNCPNINTSNVTNFNGVFYLCSSLTSIPQLDTSNGTNFNSVFYNCYSLTSIPQLDTSNGIDFGRMFYNCYSLTSIPQLDTSNGIDFGRMFYFCSSLTSIPQLDTSNGTDFSYMFGYCSSLTSIPQLDTSNGTNFNYMFFRSSKLQSIEGIDFTSLTAAPSFFFEDLTNIKRFIINGALNFSVLRTDKILSNCENELDYDTIKSWLTAASNTTNSNEKTLDFANKYAQSRTVTDQNGELQALVEACTAPEKNWIIQNLTIV